VTETLAALGEMALEDSDLVYLSPLRGAADSAYRTREAGADSRPLDEEGLFAQLESVRGGVQLGQRGGPKTAVYDIRDFLY
jgi:hypothetical protein